MLVGIDMTVWNFYSRDHVRRQCLIDLLAQQNSTREPVKSVGELIGLDIRTT